MNKLLVFFSLFLVASMVFVTTPNTVHADSQLDILKKITQNTKEHIKNDIDILSDISQVVYDFYDEGARKTVLLIQAAEKEDVATDNSLFLYIGGIAAAATVAAIVIIKRKSSRIPEPPVIVQKGEQPKPQSLDPETIFKAKQDLREDDKEIINFLSANGGQAYESELRKKFLQPRTTMWRAVKRLERQGIIEIEKKDLQNIVKLKSKLEDN